MPDPVSFPELIFGIAGPIGVDVDSISAALATCLESVGYASKPVKLTTEMLRLPAPGFEESRDPPAGKFEAFQWKMDYATALRKKDGMPDILARLAVLAIRSFRKSAEIPEEKGAYIIRQIKHPDEVTLLRQVYGKQFVLVSAYGPEHKRRKKLEEEIAVSASTQLLQSDIAHRAAQLIEKDASETGEKLGQQLRDAFHLADVFVDGLDKAKMQSGLSRFIEAFFGRTDITPSKSEYGMYAAKSASLRSSDLSRQVGAAIFSQDGELITQGCNESPRAGGGTYWDGELPDNRDVKRGFDPNDLRRKEILRDVIERLRKRHYLSDTLLEMGEDRVIVDQLTKSAATTADEPGALANSWLMDITEFSRAVHAEMCAICDAARIGRSIKAATLYCTTFPCHNCSKHIIGAGIHRVVYMEPYPKSRAKELHGDEIELESDDATDVVSFIPFLGISPLRYRDIFQKGKRKSNAGVAAKWLLGAPRPMLDIGFPAYTKTSELWAVSPLLGQLTPAEDEGNI